MNSIVVCRVNWEAPASTGMIRLRTVPSSHWHNIMAFRHRHSIGPGRHSSRCFFAIQDAISAKGNEATVRIFCLDLDRVQGLIGIGRSFNLTGPHLTGILPLARHNPRLLPQQGVLTATNLRDIEGFLLHLESKHSTSLVRAYDIHLPDPARVMRELRMIGVTAAALFPGVDVICQDLRSELFQEPP